MLKLTRKTEYALTALRHLHLVDENEVVSAKDIAAQYHIPQPLLAKVLQELSRHDLVKPVQGPKGGYSLKTKRDNITMTQFFELMEGPLGIMDCYFDSDCTLVPMCNIRTPIQRINESMRSMFENISVGEITQ